MTAAVLRLENVAKRFGPVEVIRGVDLDVEEGERHAIIGPNGAGKSTLFNLMSGRFKASSGRICLRGEDIASLSPFQISRRGLGRSFQITNIFPELSVFENLQCAVLGSSSWRYQFWKRVSRMSVVFRRAEMLLEDIGLAERREAFAGTLAYAEQRALELGIALAGNPSVLLLDEPAAGMSRSETERATSLILEIAKGRTLLIVEHDMEVVFRLAERISVLVYGQIIATGTPAQIKSDRRVQEAYLGDVSDA